MIAPPPGWTIALVEDSLLLLPGDGPTVGAIRYVERLRPLRRVVELVRAMRAPEGYVAEETSAPERLVTHEGEYAAFVVQRGRVGERPIERTFGFVFGDDFYARIAGLCFDPARAPELRATARALTLADMHLLGVRRRRFVYQPPSGWHGRVQLFPATWYPPDYPRNASSILVGAALPASAERRAELLRGLGDRPLAEMQLGPPIPVVARSGLGGTRWRLRRAAGGEMHVVILEDQTYLYPLFLETTSATADAVAIFDRVVASVEHLPVPRSREETRGARSAIHWVE